MNKKKVIEHFKKMKKGELLQEVLKLHRRVSENNQQFVHAKNEVERLRAMNGTLENQVEYFKDKLRHPFRTWFEDKFN